MKALTSEQISNLLREMGQIEGPHRAEDVPSYIQHIQFYVPRAYGIVESFVSGFIAQVIAKEDLVFQLDDWSPWDESSVYVIKSLWPEFDETRDQGFGGGLLFSPTDSAKAVALFSLVTAFGWKCYLYGEDEHSCLYNWEGEIFDAWTSSSQKMGIIKELVGQYKFELVPYGEE